MHDSNVKAKENLKGVQTSLRLHSLHAEQIKKREQKQKDKEETEINVQAQQNESISTFMNDCIKKRSRLEQEKYDWDQK